jgi:SAM-dependent methyltransferase
MTVVLLMVLAGLLIAGDVVLVIFLVAAQRNSSPAVLTPGQVLPAVVAALQLPVAGCFMDLGCGDGRVMQSVLASRPRLQVVGVENNPVLVALGRWRLRGQGQLRLGDLAKQDFGEADRVFVYLSNRVMRVLEPKFESELRPGTRVVSLHYRLPHRKPIREIEVPGAPAHAKKLYVYEY